MKKHSPSNDKLRQEYNKLLRAHKELKKQTNERNVVSRKEYDDLWVSYHQLRKNFNDRVLEAIKLFEEQQKATKEVVLGRASGKQEIHKLNNQLIDKQTRIEQLEKQLEIVKKANEELKEIIEKEQERYKTLKEEIENLKGIEKQLWEKLAEKQEIIKIQSMNNRVLLEEIIRLREGKK